MKRLSLFFLLISNLVFAGSNFIVNSTGDSPDSVLNGSCSTGATIGGQPECTLRAAIQEANNTTGSLISFNITNGCDVNNICTININTATSRLPDITSQVAINGLTQLGNSSLCGMDIPSRSNYHVVIQGDGVDIGLRLESGSSGSTISGLNIRGFFNNLAIINSSNNTIECNFIGTDETGMQVALNNNSNGIVLGCTATNNIIGGTSASKGNLISGHQVDGIQFYGGFSCNPEFNEPHSNSIVGNFIGTFKDGVTSAGNIYTGVSFFGGVANNNWIGAVSGSNTISPNVISANGTGIYIDSMDNLVIRGNYIGTDVTGTERIGNTYGGIEIVNGTNIEVGNPDSPLFANTIAYNDNGVMLTGASAANNHIERNSMYGNKNQAIEIIRDNSFTNDGQNPNDADDADTGANLLMNTVEILDYQTSYDEFLMTYILDITASIDASDTNAAYPLWITFYSTD
ncbi:MAG: CSLREA domain-containing protein, partial [Xanthomonadales bacterium]|nr:CSLREA domain-containing protein [Xanthomonadales bacterium]